MARGRGNKVEDLPNPQPSGEYKKTGRSVKFKGRDDENPIMRVSDLPDGTRHVDILVCGVERSPERVRAPYVLIVDGLGEYGLKERRMALNRTNLDFVIAKIGKDSDELIGRKVRFRVEEFENYNGAGSTLGLRAIVISPSKFPLPAWALAIDDGIPTVAEPGEDEMPDWAKPNWAD